MRNRSSLAASAIILVIASGLASCSYGSMAEAKKACYEWQSKKGRFRYESTSYETDWRKPFERSYETIVRDKAIRSCKREEVTRQWLGYEYPYKEGLLLEDVPWGDDRVVKRFRY